MQLLNTLSNLPDDVLISVFSLLSIKEALRLSVVSKRLAAVWRFSLVFNFDGLKMTPNYYHDDYNERFYKNRSKYINSINQIINSHKGSTLHEFRVKYMLDIFCMNHVDRWINFAFKKKGIQTLDLDLSQDHIGWPSEQLSPKFPQHCCDYITTIEGTSNIKFLKLLSIRSINVSSHIIHHILSNCEFLEHLQVEGSYTLTTLNVVGRSVLRLKTLKIVCCRVESMEICAPNLVTFKYYGANMNFQIRNSGSLVNVDIGGTTHVCMPTAFLKLSSYLSGLRTLRLNASIEQITNLKNLPQLINLKQLVISSSIEKEVSTLLGVTHLIMAAPFLHSFSLQLGLRKTGATNRVLKAAEGVHRCLQIVELVGFYGRPIDMEFLTFLIEKVESLHKIIINSCPSHQLRLPPSQKKTTPNKKQGRRMAFELKQKLTSLDIIIL
ncbi:F-box protein At1g80960-like [Mercurialis annua]|uniref:F-box protein At1g80960-like n=1 Tax=Mercurialis annua TaxID=3986 RepID=UPI002160236B|nr:F-box protein At1g80960-like [Mercurialis annua]